MITNATVVTYEYVVAVAIGVAKATMVASANMVAIRTTNGAPLSGPRSTRRLAGSPNPDSSGFGPAGDDRWRGRSRGKSEIFGEVEAAAHQALQATAMIYLFLDFGVRLTSYYEVFGEV